MTNDFDQVDIPVDEERERKPALDLALFHPFQQLLELIEYRQERLSDTVDRPTEAEIAAIDGEIRAVQLSPEHISGVVAIRRNWASTADTAAAEVKRLRGIIAHYECMEERLKEYVAGVLEQIPVPKKGSRKLVGVDGSQVILKRNGSLQPLVITDSTLLPNEVCRFEGWIAADLWASILEQLPEYTVNAEPKQFEMTRCADNAAIRAKLAEACEECEGGYVFDTSEVDEHTGSAKVKCPTCGGSGKQAVAGAYLAERGVHVEFK